MRPTGSHPDPIDAVLHGDGEGDDLLEAAALVHDLKSAYAPTRPLRRAPALVAFTRARLDAGDEVGAAAVGPVGSVVGARAARARETAPCERKRHPMLTGLSGFLGTLTGKVLLGTAVTAASVGGLHAADVVDVPVLPDTGSGADQAGGEGDTPAAAADGADGQATAESQRAAAAEFTAAMQEWTVCVGEAAAAQGDEASRTPGEFNPRDAEACGQQPSPSDYGITDLPDAAADAAASAAAPGAADGAPAGPADPATSIPEPGTGDPTDHGDDTPAPDDPGAPDGTPSPTVPTGRP